MEFVIDNDYMVKTDAYNFTLMKRYESKNKETGETSEKWKEIGFHGSLALALKQYMNDSIRSEENADIKRLIVKIEEVEEVIRKLIKKHKK